MESPIDPYQQDHGLLTTEGGGSSSTVMSVLAELDQTQAELQSEFPAGASGTCTGLAR